MEISETLKEKIKKNISEQKIVGLVQYSDEEFQELLSYTSEKSHFYAAGNGSYLYGEDDIHFITLVEIAKRWKILSNENDDEKGFWSFVFNTVEISVANEPKVYKAYTELILAVANGRDLPIADVHKKYYATIMMHSFAPFKSLSAFFDLIYNIYKRDLDFDYTDVDKDICNRIADIFCQVAQKLGGKNVDLSLGSSSYGIKVGLRCMALGADTREYFITLVEKVLHAINSLYHGENISTDDYIL